MNYEMNIKRRTIENRHMSQELTQKFIQMYKDHPNLWKTNSAHYRNKALKTKSYFALIKLISSEIPNADRKFVAKKINTLRVCFRKEYRKCLENKDYKPMLWYYNLLSFIVNEDSDIKQDYTNNEMDSYNEDSILLNTKYENSYSHSKYAESTDMNMSNNQDFEESLCSERINEHLNDDIISRSPSLSDNNKYTDMKEYIPKSKRFKQKHHQTYNEEDSDLENRNSAFGFQKISHLKYDEFEAFGHFISKKLSIISSQNYDQYIFCENIINQAIMKAQLGKLKENSTITC